MKIEIEHVSKKIKDALVLDDVCMTLESGNIYGFQGVNGSGKTMLMRAVSGLMYPTSGTISIDGKVLGKNMAFPEKIGMLIENPAFIDSYTGYDNLKMLASINKGEVDISRALETVGCWWASHPVRCCTPTAIWSWPSTPCSSTKTAAWWPSFRTAATWAFWCSLSCWASLWP